jgi:DNA processing protein
LKACAIEFNDAISPHLEIGAFEALWANKEVASFKQIREKLKDVDFLSAMVDKSVANEFYAQTLLKLCPISKPA